jgi:hypothetical protein
MPIQCGVCRGILPQGGFACRTCSIQNCGDCSRMIWADNQTFMECRSCVRKGEMLERSSDPSKCGMCAESLPYGGFGCSQCRITLCEACVRYGFTNAGTTTKCASCAPEIRAPKLRAKCSKCDKRTMTECDNDDCAAKYCEVCHEDGFLAQWLCERCCRSYRRRWGKQHKNRAAHKRAKLRRQGNGPKPVSKMNMDGYQHTQLTSSILPHELGTSSDFRSAELF